MSDVVSCRESIGMCLVWLLTNAGDEMGTNMVIVTDTVRRCVLEDETCWFVR